VRVELKRTRPKVADLYPHLLFHAKARAFSTDLETEISAFHGQNEDVGKGQPKVAGHATESSRATGPSPAKLGE
jgi:hypothetical protein